MLALSLGGILEVLYATRLILNLVNAHGDGGTYMLLQDS
jgi:hypothetical protein